MRQPAGTMRFVTRRAEFPSSVSNPEPFSDTIKRDYLTPERSLCRRRFLTIPVPLLPGDSDVPLNLETVLHDVYERNGYVRRLDDTQPAPAPPMTDKQTAWLKSFAIGMK